VATGDRVHEDGYDEFIECGPGKTLVGLIRRIGKSAKAVSYIDILGGSYA
jgi:malonyl CoA-acyl carrier protein transacylase